MLFCRTAAVISDTVEKHLRVILIFISCNSLVTEVIAVAVKNMKSCNGASVGAVPIVKRAFGKILLFRITARTEINIVFHSRFSEKLGQHAIVTERVNIVARLGYCAEILLEKSL